ncbi:PLP-dependent aspartate aminotransferase family protein [Amycolatopsis sp. NBC_00345]|uniref:trans-sulfuration enzyme family protein n=1 Tax=Amycolatopsis sp. NBC_00345 TaxID=2975955 RepID=UPI002E26A095
MKFDTKLVLAGQDAEPGTGDLVPPLHLATTYERGVQDPPRYFYARGENPTRENLETCLASLEDARFADVYSSGQAAGMTALSLLGPGDRLLCSDDVYGGTYGLLAETARRGIDVVQADLSDPETEIPQGVSLVWVETPTNPLLKITDLERLARRARERGARVLVDNTLAGPVLQQPLRHADISLYSTTKGIAGHLDVLGGALVYSDEELHERFRSYRTIAGNVPGPLDCYLVHRGLKTLSLRVERQVRTAAALAEVLVAEPSVGRVRYPGLPDDPGYALARRQMTAPGSMISFDYRGDPGKLLELVRVFACAVSLGGVRSLIECPAAMTHRPVPAERRRALGITDELIRLSVGIEDPGDLTEDLRSALRAGHES